MAESRHTAAEQEQGQEETGDWHLYRHLTVAARLRGDPLPARPAGLCTVIPRVEDQRALVLVSVLVCDTALVVTVQTKGTKIKNTTRVTTKLCSVLSSLWS